MAPTLGADATRPPVLVHFHGAPSVTEAAFRAAGLDGVLLVVNCNGLSSAYREPFENPELFAYVLDSQRAALIAEGRLPADAEWGRVDVSFFSAGYGAARELLRHDSSRERIAAIVAADSIYASIHEVDGRRRVDVSQMAPFLAFTEHAVLGKKAFLWTHSQLPVEAYASTVETADYVLNEVNLARESTRADADVDPADFSPISIARRGRFVVRGYPGTDGEAHMAHLRQINSAWRWLAEDRANAAK